MRYAILSDIHSNLEALKAVLDTCLENRIDQFLCVGDIVGYGADPKHCLETVCELNALHVAGNHDWAVSGKFDSSFFNEEGKAAIEWTQAHLAKDDFDWLSGLELIINNEDLVMVHGALHKPESFIYLDDISKAPDTFYLMEHAVCFIGHTHVPQIYILQGENIAYAPTTTMKIRKDAKYIINVGSVGQPRDGNPMASFGIFDTKIGVTEIKRVAYDIASAQKKILEAGLPEVLAKRLSVGL